MADSDFEQAKAELGAALDARLTAYLDQIGQKMFTTVPDVLRADEFKLDADRRGQDMFRAITAVLHAPEFAGWQQETRDAAATIKDLSAKVDALTAAVAALTPKPAE